MDRMDMTRDQKNGLRFRKMHGLGNDFVIIDARNHATQVTAAIARAVGDRHFGVGFDQLAVLSQSDGADVEVKFFNSDGSVAGACGNASRCVARIIMEETGKNVIQLRTERGLLPARRNASGEISVNMGKPQLNWDEVPLAHPVDDMTALPIEGAPGAAGMGNPHMVFVVEDAEAIDLSDLGPRYEHHPLYPERANVEFIHIISRDETRMRVWERGGMVTHACGSGACASAVVAHLKGLTERALTVHADGGALQIDWREDGVWMTGPTTYVFDGVLTSEFIEAI